MNALKAWMQASGRTPKSLAEELGVSPQAVYYWLSATWSPSLGMIARLDTLSDGRVTARDFYPAAPVGE